VIITHEFKACFLSVTSAPFLSTKKGDIVFRKAVGQEAFVPFGSDQTEHPEPGRSQNRADLSTWIAIWKMSVTKDVAKAARL